ncbi:MAG: hypothetical protein HRT88_00160 [Lentisphaeraceae bacterium]|nr:hypothetical protein [Lentisphaeraceae bacterium]
MNTETRKEIETGINAFHNEFVSEFTVEFEGVNLDVFQYDYAQWEGEYGENWQVRETYICKSGEDKFHLFGKGNGTDGVEFEVNMQFLGLDEEQVDELNEVIHFFDTNTNTNSDSFHIMEKLKNDAIKNIDLSAIQSAAHSDKPIFIDGYKVSVFDDTSKTKKEWSEATGEDVEDFEPDCSDVAYGIYFVDDAGLTRKTISIGYRGYENAFLEDADLDLLEKCGLTE